MAHLQLVTIVVDEYDPAIRFFVDVLGFDLVDDSPSLTNFDAHCSRMRDAGVEFVTPPRTESYGRVVVFLDIAGNRWDLLGPA